jgi:hypothetical protein
VPDLDVKEFPSLAEDRLGCLLILACCNHVLDLILVAGEAGVRHQELGPERESEPARQAGSDEGHEPHRARGLIPGSGEYSFVIAHGLNYSMRISDGGHTNPVNPVSITRWR